MKIHLETKSNYAHEIKKNNNINIQYNIFYHLQLKINYNQCV
jgi:hypothetical protein